MKSACLTLVISTVLQISAFTQNAQSARPTLELGSSEGGVENRISFDLSRMMIRSLHSTTGSKINLKPKSIVINGETFKPKRINTRGQSTLMYKRKSLSVRLNSEAVFHHGDATESMMNFTLLSLSMDKYYCHNHLSFGLMEAVGLHHLFYSFCDLRINDNSEGIFMVIERPEDWAFNKKKSPVIIRRGFDHSISEIKTDNITDQDEKEQYISYYKEIYHVLNACEGEELYETLQKYMDIDHYMTWLAFNFLVHNGDYSDEVFFYFDPDFSKYRIIPWDYDDIMVSSPHEGLKQRNQTIGSKMLFSGEDQLDSKIANDSFLYSMYIKRLRELLQIITPEILKECIENTYAELHPYYSDDEIISNVQFDCYKDASLENLSDYLAQIYSLLSEYRETYLENLE
jgi:spore coat protein H